MKPLSKEEVLWSFPQGESEPYGRVPTDRIYEAMDEYTKQYGRWILQSGYQIFAGMYYHSSDEGGENPLTPDQLYEIYLTT